MAQLHCKLDGKHSRSRGDVMRLSNKRSPYLFGVATANRTKVTTPNKYGAEIIARMSDWENEIKHQINLRYKKKKIARYRAANRYWISAFFFF